jgi:nucleoside-diphosphate-sugar epimerase
MKILIPGAATELGLELIRQLAGIHDVTGLVERQSQADKVSQSGTNVLVVDFADAIDLERAMHEAQADIVLNLAPQYSNTLLHDGLAWRNSEKSLPAETAALLHAANDSDISYLLHASYAFLYGPAPDSSGVTADESTAIARPAKNKLFSAAIEAEKMVAANKHFPVCIMRIGYLYGPQSRDLALYEASFKLRRPYYAGSKKHVGNFVHFSDAARAIALAAEKQPADEIINVVDGTAVSFGTFIDTYANCLGRQKPRRLPTTAVRFLPLTIAPQQIKQLNIRAAQVDSSKAGDLLGWTPEYPSYEQGLAQTVRVQRGQKD